MLKIKNSTTLMIAAGIMGERMFTTDHVEQHFGVKYPEEELDSLSISFPGFPFSEDTLRKCRNTHILFPGYPLSSANIVIKTRLWLAKLNLGGIFMEQDWTNGKDDAFWYLRHPFARKEYVSTRWYLIRTEALPGSIGKPYLEQAALVPKEEDVPLACEMIYAMALYHLVYLHKYLVAYERWQRLDGAVYREQQQKTGLSRLPNTIPEAGRLLAVEKMQKQILQNSFVRTRSSIGHLRTARSILSVNVGYDHTSRICLSDSKTTKPDDNLGIATSWKTVGFGMAKKKEMGE